MGTSRFDAAFHALTGSKPFPWQQKLYKQFIEDRHDNIPSSCTLATGLGKTLIIAIWLIALANRPQRMPRRLVYVVNRRTVVDQTTDDVMNLRKNLAGSGLQASLQELCALECEIPLAISTLRGQFADNREWSADPCRPAVIIGTVDMIGSRLLFSGYNLGFKARPLHAGFLGQDALLVHDEAHLEPAFQKLLKEIEAEQTRERQRSGELPWHPLRVMELSATSRQENNKPGEPPFTLTDEEKDPPKKIPKEPTAPIHTVWRRLRARKKLHLIPTVDAKKELPDKIFELATQKRFAETNQVILIYARTVDHVGKIFEKLKKKVGEENVCQLTGTMRGLERDRLPYDEVFARFLAPSSRPEDLKKVADDRTVYLVCTSAGEVGVNLSADHLICDLTTFESMAQRFGRVNRFGDNPDTEIHVVHPEEFDEELPYEQSRQRTLELLRRLNGDASPLALMELRDLDVEAHQEAFTPTPTIVPATDILFDAWSLTTIRDKLPGRPPVEVYLHGAAEWQPPETYVAWREEVALIDDSLLALYPPDELIGDYPLKPHELLRDQTNRVLEELKKMAKRLGDDEVPAWVVSDSGVETKKLSKIIDLDQDDLADCTVLLPPLAGGLNGGMLDGTAKAEMDELDVADQWLDENENKRRLRFQSENPVETPPDQMRLVRPPIDLDPDAEEDEEGDGESETPSSGRYWHWFVRPQSADDDGSKTSVLAVLLDDHTEQVTQYADAITAKLRLSPEMQAAVQVAAQFHDNGKKRKVWQRSIGNRDLEKWYAKSGKIAGKRLRPIDLGDYRHEFGSLLDVADAKEINELHPDFRDLALHLIAAHHGRGRPHFPAMEVVDSERRGTDVDSAAAEVPRRFAKLQRKYGRWGLAYLESLLRAADWAASNKPQVKANAVAVEELMT